MHRTHYSHHRAQAKRYFEIAQTFKGPALRIIYLRRSWLHLLLWAARASYGDA